MFLEGREIEPVRAARALSVWMAGLGFWIAVALGQGVVRWYLFADDAYLHAELMGALSPLLQVGGVGAGLAIAFGALGYVRATEPTATWLKALVGVLFLLPPIDAVFLYLEVTSQLADFADRRPLYEALGHLWTVCTLAEVGVLVLLYTRMARLSEAQGRGLGRARVWAAIVVAGLWGVVVATARLGVLAPLRGLAGHLVDVGLTVGVAATALALLHPHRGHLRTGAVDAAAPPSPDDGALAPAGRGLRRYHGAIIALIGFQIPANLLILGVARGGDADAARGLTVVVLLIGFVIQLVAVSGLVAFARRIPALHAARGAADLAAGVQVFSAVASLATVVLVIRAFQSGRLSLLFDLQDQLPIIEGLGVLLGCVAALSLLTAIDRTGALGAHDTAGSLKAGIPALGGFVMLFKLLDHRHLGGPATIAFAMALLVALIVTAVTFLRRVRRAADAMQMGAETD